MNPTQAPSPHSELRYLAEQLTGYGLRASLITPTCCLPYLHLTGPTRQAHCVYAHGRRFHLATTCPIGSRDDIPLAAAVITWALHAHAIP